MRYFIAGLNVRDEPRVIELKGRPTKAQFILDKEGNDKDVGWIADHRSRIPISELYQSQTEAIFAACAKLKAEKQRLQEQVDRLDEGISALERLYKR